MSQPAVILFESFGEDFEHLGPVLKQVAGDALHDLLLQLAQLSCSLILALTFLVEAAIRASLNPIIEGILLRSMMVVALFALVEQIAGLL